MDADTFTHPVSAYQILAEQGNVAAESTLNLVHTTESMLRDKAVVYRMPDVTKEPSEEFGDDSDEDEVDSLEEAAMNIGGEEGPSSLPELPEWALAKESNQHLFGVSVITQIRNIQRALLVATNPGTRALLHKLQHLRQELTLDTVRKDVEDLKTFTDKKIEERLPSGAVKELLLKLRKESEMEKKVTPLETRVKNIEESMVVLL